MLHSAVIEVRQHLCCANVFLKFKQSLTDLESFKIIVDASKVKLQHQKYSEEVFVSKFFSILAGSFSNLTVDTENASFRISVKDIQFPGACENPNRAILQLNFTEREEVDIICMNCAAKLFTQKKFEKVREFPSGAIDFSEFFCHHGPNFKDILVPTERDLFYGFQFIVLNMSTIEKSTREKENHIYCRRCLKYFGEAILNNSAAKLWCDSLHLSLMGKKVNIFSSDGRSLIYQLILKAIEESSLPAPEPLLRNMHFTKVLLVATFPNRQQQYLLLNILEKHLKVLLYEETVASINGPQNTKIELNQHNAFKILYRLISKDDDNNDKEAAGWPPILEYWEQDINILKMKISPYLFNTLNNELNKNNKLLPEIYRLSHEEFSLSYVFY